MLTMGVSYTAESPQVHSFTSHLPEFKHSRAERNKVLLPFLSKVAESYLVVPVQAAVGQKADKLP